MLILKCLRCNKLLTQRFNTMKIKTIIFYLIIGIILVSCKKEDTCPETIYRGDFTYTQKSLDSVPYLNKTTIVFRDSLNQEIEFTVTDKGDSDWHWVFWGHCASNYYDTVNYDFNAKAREIEIKNDSINFYFTLYISTLLDFEYFQEYDLLFINHNYADSNSFQNLEIMTDQRSIRDKDAEKINSPILFETEFEIFEKTYHNVYHNKYMDMYFANKLYYNSEYGIVSFKDNSGKRWVFERFY